jgi:MutS domain I
MAQATAAPYGALVRQYLALRDARHNILLLVRSGSFYEVRFDDAELVARGWPQADRPSNERVGPARATVRLSPSRARRLVARRQRHSFSAMANRGESGPMVLKETLGHEDFRNSASHLSMSGVRLPRN